jgi:hypothetical protein
VRKLAKTCLGQITYCILGIKITYGKSDTSSKNCAAYLYTGLPDGLFSNQKYQFG